MPKRWLVPLAALFWLTLWEIAALCVGKPLLLPSPIRVCARLTALARTGDFWRITAASIGRTIAGIGAGALLGALCAAGALLLPVVGGLLSPLMGAIRAVPVVSFILPALIWMGRDFVPMLTALLMVLPAVYAALLEGHAAVDIRLLEMARVYRFGRLRTLRRVLLPVMLPRCGSALRASAGLAWKAAVAAEVLTVPKAAIGSRMYEAKLYWELPDLLAWTLCVVALSLLLEALLSLPERRNRRA